jgi:RNA polymerase sigma-70 factor (ECF subfamily)
LTTDEDLMASVQRGSRDAFEALFERYRDPLWRFYRRRVADNGKAEELVQDTFVAVLQGTIRYQPRAAFRSYLFGIAFNIFHADRRKAALRQAVPLLADAAAAEGDGPDIALWVRAGLERLDADDRDVLMLREYEQLSYQEIADVKGLPINTVKSRLFRARLALRTALEERVPAAIDIRRDAGAS